MGSIRIEVVGLSLFTPLSSRADCRASELMIVASIPIWSPFTRSNPLRAPWRSPEDVAAADDDAYLDSRSDDGFDLLRIAVEHVRSKDTDF